jgi:two-component system sensor histidine kinase GlrK
MKLATRMAVCLTLLAGLLIATSLYQLQLVERIHAIASELSVTAMEARRISIGLQQGIEGLDEFAEKTLLDPDYLGSWGEWERAVAEDVRALEELPLADAELAHRERLTGAWRSYLVQFSTPARDSLTSRRPGSRPLAGPEMVATLDSVMASLRAATDSLILANELAVARRAQEAGVANDQARQAAWMAGGASLSLAIVLSLGLWFYTSGPLRRLNRGTREIAGGNFSHRIPVRGGDELSKLAADFNKMASKLGEVEELKKDFISHVSHELKGPLAAIQETNLILLERIPGPLTGKQEHLLELSHQSSKRLSVMIGNLLGVSRLEAGSMQYQFELHDVAESTCDVVDELSALAQEKDLDVRLEFAPVTTLSCDSERLREVLANLVGNAYKFSPRGATVRIGWRQTDSPPGRAPAGRDGVGPPYLVLSVEDEGPGVPDAHKEGIFEKFYQVRRHTRTRGQGVGLGLAIAKKIVEAHGGRIWVEDGEPRGSRFQAVFPGAASSPRAQEMPAPEGTPADRGEPLVAGLDLRPGGLGSSTR